MFFYISGILYYLQVILIYLSSLWGAPLSTRMAKNICFDRFNFWYFYPIYIRDGNKTKACWQFKLF